jgi:hypothetical protein
VIEKTLPTTTEVNQVRSEGRIRNRLDFSEKEFWNAGDSGVTFASKVRAVTSSCSNRHTIPMQTHVPGKTLPQTDNTTQNKPPDSSPIDSQNTSKEGKVDSKDEAVVDTTSFGAERVATVQPVKIENGMIMWYRIDSAAYLRSASQSQEWEWPVVVFKDWEVSALECFFR